MLRLIFFFVLTAICFTAEAADIPIKLIEQLDAAIDSSNVYVAQKEARIGALRAKIGSRRKDIVSDYEICNALAEEYRAYMCDSSVFFLEESIRLAKEMDDGENLVVKDKLSLSYLLSSSGYYLPAVDILRSIDSHRLSNGLLARYYECYEKAYAEMSNYSRRVKEIDYAGMAKKYRDSLMQVLPARSPLRLSFEEEELRNAGKYDEALKINDIRIAKIAKSSPDYALVMFHRSLIYQLKWDREKEMEALAKSAITDIRLGIKDHASLWMLAGTLYRRGDIDRAYRYMRFSWKDTKTFNAPLRSWQSAEVLSLVEERYSEEISRSNVQYKVLVSVVSLLFILLVLAMLFIYKQNKRLRLSNEEQKRAHEEVKETNSKLKKLNDDLEAVNKSLVVANMNLYESNNIKEVYFTKFIKLCSEYIDKLNRFRNTVSSKLSTGQIAELKKQTQSNKFMDEVVKEFYQNFDSAFLHIFPDFVDKVNDLLVDTERIELKEGELLNPELRVFALIRLGFNNSSQIAEFLRYSVNTIYNYRAKVKNKAKVDRNDFENLIKQIH